MAKIDKVVKIGKRGDVAQSSLQHDAPISAADAGDGAVTSYNDLVDLQLDAWAQASAQMWQQLIDMQFQWLGAWRALAHAQPAPVLPKPVQDSAGFSFWGTGQNDWLAMTQQWIGAPANGERAS